MEYARVSQNSGLKIAKVIVGAMSYGSSKWAGWVLDEKESIEMLEYCYSKGLNTWDTADLYSNGESENIIRKTIEKNNIPRENLVILSKCYFGCVTDGTYFPQETPETYDTYKAILT